MCADVPTYIILYPLTERLATSCNHIYNTDRYLLFILHNTVDSFSKTYNAHCTYALGRICIIYIVPIILLSYGHNATAY